MRISKAVVSITLAAGASLVGLPAVAHAQGNINPPPPPGPAPGGAPAPAAEQIGPARAPGVTPGWQVSAGAGTGFGGTYEFGVEGRAGYTLPMGLYLGGDVQGYWGNSALGNQAHATFFGAEAGYEWYPTQSVEVRPYGFVGPAFVTQVSDNGTASSHTNIGFQPGALALVHFGEGFAGADARLMVAPAPFAVSLMGMVGLGFGP